MERQAIEPGESSRGERRTGYEPPAVVYESDLEVRAGSPMGIPDPFNPTGIGE